MQINLYKTSKVTLHLCCIGVRLVGMVMFLLVCVCWVGGFLLCQNSSVTLGNDQSSPWDPLPYTLSQPANWTGIAQPCSPRSTQDISRTHTLLQTHICARYCSPVSCLSSLRFLLFVPFSFSSAPSAPQFTVTRSLFHVSPLAVAVSLLQFHLAVVLRFFVLLLVLVHSLFL